MNRRNIIIGAALAGAALLAGGAGLGIFLYAKNNPCFRVTCPTGRTCDPKTGKCVEKDAVCGTCTAGLECDKVTGLCSCTSTSCPAPSHCSDDGKQCITSGGECDGAVCQERTRCVGGKCVCDEVSCPSPYICKDGLCQQRRCEDGCPADYACVGGYCEPKATCTSPYVWVPATNTCEAPKTCDDDAGYTLDPQTNECRYVGRVGITDVSYLVNPGIDGNPTTCPSGFKDWWMHTNFRQGSIYAPVFGCKKQERAKGDAGMVGYSLAFKTSCPAGTVQDSTDINPGSIGKLYTCKSYGDVSSPYYIRDIDAVNYTKGERCENLGPGWSYGGWQLSWGETIPGDDIRVCIKRGKL